MNGGVGVGGCTIQSIQYVCMHTFVQKKREGSRERKREEKCEPEQEVAQRPVREA